MGRVPCCEKIGLNRGKWTSEEDEKLINYIKANGDGCWRSLPKNAGLLRCGKSCRLRWINYLRDDVKRGNFTEDEEETIVKLHKTLGNKWSVIARRLPGRTDNEIKNYWNSHLSRQIYRFRSSGELLLSSVDVIKMAKPSNRRSGRVSRAVAKKYNNNNINLPSVTSTKHSDKISITVVNKQTATKEAGTNCPRDARERDLNPLGSHEDGVPKSSNEDGTFSRCVLSSEDWPSAFIVSPKEGGDREMLGPWEEVNEENLLMQLNKYEEGVAIYGGEDVVISEGTDKVVIDMDSATASEEMYCRDWSSNTEVGSLYGCLSPIVSYFENDELCWNVDGGAAAGNEISFWSEEEDLLIWS